MPDELLSQLWNTAIKGFGESHSSGPEVQPQNANIDLHIPNKKPGRPNDKTTEKPPEQSTAPESTQTSTTTSPSDFLKNLQIGTAAASSSGKPEAFKLNEDPPLYQRSE